MVRGTHPTRGTELHLFKWWCYTYFNPYQWQPTMKTIQLEKKFKELIILASMRREEQDIHLNHISENDFIVLSISSFFSVI
jgi:hypothetical protein